MRALTASSARGRADGRAPLLIMTDQEGGRGAALPLGPAGRGLGRGARAARPRGDPPHAGARPRRRSSVSASTSTSPRSRTSRAPGLVHRRERPRVLDDPTRAAKDVTAFSAGLLDGGVAPTLKHFPGLGLATTSTDDAAVTDQASAEALEPGFAPYRRAIAAGVAPLVMVSNAAYAAYGGRPRRGRRACSRPVAGLGFTGVTITDALEPLASTHDVPLGQAAIRAARAGVDLLLFVGSERSTERVYDPLLAEARAGRSPARALERSAARIDELAATYAG